MIAYARPAMPRIGVISDTHGLVRPEALRALAGADLIVHAGDVGTPEVLEALRAVAPVVAVRGNNDRGRWARALAETEVVERSGRSLYVLHDPARPASTRSSRGTRTSRASSGATAFSISTPEAPDRAASGCRSASRACG